MYLNLSEVNYMTKFEFLHIFIKKKLYVGQINAQ